MGKKSKAKRDARHAITGQTSAAPLDQLVRSYLTDVGRRPRFGPHEEGRFWEWLEVRHGDVALSLTRP